MFSRVPVRKAFVAASLLTILSVQAGVSAVGAQSSSSSSSRATYAFGLTADLTATQDGPASVTRGSTATYSFLISNLGPGVASNVILTDDIPAGVVFQKALSDARCNQASATQVTCDVGDIVNNQPVIVRVAFQTPLFDACVDTPVTNVGSVQSFQVDPNMNNNRSQAVTTVVTCGASLTECQDARDNDGDGLIDLRDPGCRNAQENDETRDEVQAQIDRERQREELRRQMRMRGYFSSSSAPLPPPPVIVPVPVPVPVTRPRRVQPRPPVRVRAANPLSVSVHAAQQEAQPGDTVLYTITVRNSSDDPQNGVEVVATYPADRLTVVDGSNGAASDGRIAWTIDTLRPHQTRTISFSGELAKSLRHGDTVVLQTRVDSAGSAAFGSSSIDIIQALPQAGASPFTGPLENGGRFLRPFGASSTGGAAIAFTILGLMLSAGAGLAVATARRGQK